MIGLVVINADDQRMIKIKGKILIMIKNAVKCNELPQYSKKNKTYFGQFINCSFFPNQIT